MIDTLKTNLTVNDDGQIVTSYECSSLLIDANTYTGAESAQVAACIVERRIRDGSWDVSETLGAFVRRIFPQDDAKETPDGVA